MLAAVVITAAVGLVDAHAVRRLYRVRRPEFVLWLTAFLGVAVLGVLVGILVAIVLSLADFVRRAWRPYDAVLGREDELKGYHDLERHPNARQVPGLLLYRFDAPLFFANADYFRRRISDLVATTTPPSAGSWWRPSPSPMWTPPPPTPSWSCSVSCNTRRWCSPSPR
jgi:MFS superfamily sulfate permease-like transporter